MKLIENWRNSIEPCIRLIFIALGVNLILLPLAAFQSEALPKEIKIALSVLYVLTVAPYLTAEWIRICGFKLNKRICGGGMNEAAQAKQQSLDREKELNQTAQVNPCNPPENPRIT
jgi:hypothetical protein